jgi:hypothetical protein
VGERVTEVAVDQRLTAAASPALGRRREARRWLVVIIATVVSTCALDVIATATGVLLVASPLFDGATTALVVGLLVSTYGLWMAGLRDNLRANWCLLEQTGTSTNVLSKAAFELVRRRSVRRNHARAASAVGYLAAEFAKEAPYYLGALGTSVASDSVDSADALLFLAGTNVGAAAYEFGVARLSRAVVARRSPGRELGLR